VPSVASPSAWMPWASLWSYRHGGIDPDGGADQLRHLIPPAMPECQVIEHAAAGGSTSCCFSARNAVNPIRSMRLADGEAHPLGPGGRAAGDPPPAADLLVDQVVDRWMGPTDAVGEEVGPAVASWEKMRPAARGSGRRARCPLPLGPGSACG